MVKLTVIMPIYNEANTVNRIIEKVKSVNLGEIEKELIAVDDCSTDGTHKILEKIDDIKLVRHRENRGKGAAIQTGIKHATGDIVIIQDADLEYNPNDYPALLQPILEGKTKVVYGSRFLNEKKTGRNSKVKLTHSMMHKTFYIGNKFLSLLTRIIYGVKITDMETCYKVFSYDVIKEIPLKSKRFDFEPEITAKIIKRGHKIIEVPISYKPRTIEEGKKIGWKDGARAIYCLLKYRFF
jgi:glycosyltransferase involved in cell wall biosynthesis